MGVAIVEARDLSGIDTLSWSVDAEKSLTIGLTEGAHPYMFASIAGVARLSDGTIVIADRGAGEVRFYDSTGTFRFAKGGLGDGPLEYRAITMLKKLSSDSIMVMDRDGTRITVLDHDGTQARRYLMAVRVGSELPRPAWAVFSDGSQLTMPLERIDNIAPGVIQHSAYFQRVREGARIVVESYQGALLSQRMVNTAIASPSALGGEAPGSSWAVGENLFLFAPNNLVAEWWVYSAAGGPERILRVTDTNLWPVSAESAVAGKFTADSHGALWIELNTTHEGKAEPVWIVWPRGQGPQYAVRLPPVAAHRGAAGTPVMEIGADYVLIASVNEDGAPVVRMLKLVRLPADR